MKSISFALLFACCFGVLNASADTIESVMMPGKVIQGHVKWEDNCQKCHKKFDKEGQNTLCKDCHKDINKDVAEKKGFHGKIKEAKNCAECHTERLSDRLAGVSHGPEGSVDKLLMTWVEQSVGAAALTVATVATLTAA